MNSPHKGQWRRAFMFSLICARRNRCVNNEDAGDLRRQFVLVMMSKLHLSLLGLTGPKRWARQQTASINILCDGVHSPLTVDNSAFPTWVIWVDHEALLPGVFGRGTHHNTSMSGRCMIQVLQDKPRQPATQIWSVFSLPRIRSNILQ